MHVGASGKGCLSLFTNPFFFFVDRTHHRTRSPRLAPPVSAEQTQVKRCRRHMSVTSGKGVETTSHGKGLGSSGVFEFCACSLSFCFLEGFSDISGEITCV